MIERPELLNNSEFSITPHRYCPNLKARDWFAIEKAMTGDAPKDFLAVYQYGITNCRRAQQRTWPRYIAKVGHKWYPNESITEHLITRIGQALRMRTEPAKASVNPGSHGSRFINGHSYRKGPTCPPFI